MPYPIELIRDLARRHGIAGEPELLPAGGMVNDAYLIGDAVLRIVREDGDPECDPEAAREAAVVPLATAAGVMTPELLAADPQGLHAPRPYSIYRRAKGTLMGYASDPPPAFREAFRELGREIVKIASITPPEGLGWHYRSADPPNPRDGLAKARNQGLLSQQDTAEIERWIADLEPFQGSREPLAMLHNDLHPWNLMVDPHTRQLTAILDWGDAGEGDRAREFCSMPLFAVPDMIEGFREVGGQWTDDMDVRARLFGLELALWELLNLDTKRFARSWWRCPPDGWRALISA